MNKEKLVRIVLWCGMVLVAMYPAASVMASPIIADNFNSGAPGTSIDGQLTPIGGATWVIGTDTSAVYTYQTPTNNNVTSYGSSLRGAQATVAMGDMLSYNSTITFIADVLVAGGDDYVGLGFFTSTNPDWNNISQPQLRLHPDGSWTFQNLSGGSIANFTAGVYHRVVLEYEVNNDNLAFYLDGDLIATQWVWQSGWRGITPTALGFRINNTGGSSMIDNIYAYTPEPATMMLLGAGALGLLRKRRV